MGEAKQRSRRRDLILSKSDRCIFCGGGNPASTVDHVPPIGMFTRRDRPSGLEFPACLGCNNGSRKIDQIVSFLSRISVTPATNLEMEEFERQCSALAKVNLPLMIEMKPTFRQRKIARKALGDIDAGALNCRGPLLNEAMNSFAAKIGAALHFEMTGKFLGINSLIFPIWMTNEAIFDDLVPHDLIDMLGDLKSLKQGRKNSEEQFAYKSAKCTDSDVTAHVAFFRSSFMTITAIAPEENNLNSLRSSRWSNVFQPGWLLSD